MMNRGKAGRGGLIASLVLHAGLIALLLFNIPWPEREPEVPAREVIQAEVVETDPIAERRRAEVALLGYASAIATAEVGGATVYRVQIGPLAGGEASEAESRLKQASIEPLRRRVEP